MNSLLGCFLKHANVKTCKLTFSWILSSPISSLSYSQIQIVSSMKFRSHRFGFMYGSHSQAQIPLLEGHPVLITFFIYFYNNFMDRTKSCLIQGPPQNVLQKTKILKLHHPYVLQKSYQSILTMKDLVLCFPCLVLQWFFISLISLIICIDFTSQKVNIQYSPCV